LSICPYQERNGQKDILKEHCINKGGIMNEIKTMDYQKFNDYWTKLSKPIDLGFFDKLLIAEEIAIMFQENPNRHGYTDNDVKTEVIRIVSEHPSKWSSTHSIDGYVVVGYYE
tara:strand:+ start:1109 stop:1447 length:339 start_codon:yes stop_codon:yes gene_type:complete